MPQLQTSSQGVFPNALLALETGNWELLSEAYESRAALLESVA